MPFEIIRNDITKMKVDAIVNSANPQVFVGAGVDGAIHAAAGPGLFEARKLIGEITVGSAIATPAFMLNAKYVIHTVGPIWHGGTEHEMENVKDCYTNALKVALDNKCRSIAFPLISTGTYGFPKADALQSAISAISGFLLVHDMKVFLVVYDRTSYSLAEKLFAEVTEFIDDNYTDNYENFNSNRFILLEEIQEIRMYKTKRSFDDLIDELEETFSQSLLRRIDEKSKTDVEIYKKANVDRKLFSKIRSNKDYRPSKATAIAFAIALELNLDETKDLIKRAGFALSHSNRFDLIIEYFIKEEIYDIFEINEVLFAFDQDLLGK
ncbi:MAG: macro domain-containing protein [Saccharofermentanales bacterium]